MAKRLYGVLGLGIFGSSVCKTLNEYDCEVLAVDIDMTCVDRVADFATRAVQADMTNIDQLRQIGIGECDVVIVGSGKNLEDSILAILNLKELGVPYIVAKAKNKQYMTVLEKIGANRIIRPEKEAGERIAKSLLSNNIVDLIDVDDDYSIVDIHVPQTWVGHSLIELNIRQRFGINIIGVRHSESSKLDMNVNPTYLFDNDDQVLVVAETDKIEKLDILDKLK